MIRLVVAPLLAVLLFWPATLRAADEVPSLQALVDDGTLPAMADRIPDEPFVVDNGREIGTYGSDWNMLITRSKDTRLLVVFGYARLVGYTPANLEIVPDILESFEVEEERIFTLHLREGHRWSDGHPFTAEDFRYWWEDVANHAELSPSGPPTAMLVNGEPPVFEVIDETTVRYTWADPNPEFLPTLASASPTFIYRPAHFMKQFHADYGDIEDIARMVEEKSKTSWTALHNAEDDMYKFDSATLPTLQPWTITNEAPAQRFIGARNPFYYKVDAEGQQLPYIDRVLMNVVDSKLIPLKTWAGEADLQARGLSFNDYTFLKEGEEHNDFSVHLWQTARGSQLALFPNLNAADDVWREVIRDIRFRRAMSLAVNRHEINQVIYYGLGIPGQNTVLPESPLYEASYREAYAEFDLDEANRLLDDMGLTERNSSGVRLLPDGRPMEIIVETAGENAEETDILELIHDSWLAAGVKLFSKPLQREVLRNRVFAGLTNMSIWFGSENGVPSADMSPWEFAPSTQQLFQWPRWGQYFETGGEAGVPIDMDQPARLMELYLTWRTATSQEERQAIWQEMLEINAQGVYSIGLVAGTLQPIVVSNRMRNVPGDALFNWDPGAQFGMYQPETFFFVDGDNGRP
ncbi:MAG: ABC transporter substrate-binding protein [Alphaproteobacteria bacterium]|jgi:peptide/nickel transport system substrate-binding protein|nr:ABC transporter substrate-binding protein [Rhodospirillaceae bacterium]MBT6206338.1 ABC transporter substrate-binding protein [Rhodospirillaceae bacterium]MBT6512050.1 ABC transporter substrate-binding protein [Rhodospirillaceae bacterium]MBT7647278.1 ABC transporter substrate-binding protein [Rhodospirillaceae bacterium]MDG2479384.1 ABC transporter substrate-binding protein [Alphaproteobacteria bacterium]